ncbi:MAG: alpha/beta fold hydrolase [Hyphomonadaceae bacterium]|nr:alpha/beta fold hydrolase [Hyphomonadaceae bacterium]
MTMTLALWLVGGAVVLLLMLLVIVLIARSLETKSSPAATTPASSKADAAAATAMKALFGAALGEKIAGANKQSGKTSGKHISLAIGGAVGAIFIGSAIAEFVDSSRPDPASLEPIEISAGDLHGTLLSPKAKAPVVLIVPGSGPTDRNGNSPMGVNTDMYKLLAEGLAREGIATVRVDKRGMFGSKGAGDPNTVSVDIYANDYRGWIHTIREQTGRKCVWLLGHSEGALMVSAAAQGRKDVCGLILVSGMGRKMGDVLRQQLQDNPANAPLLDQAFAAISALEGGQHYDTTNMHPALLPLFAPPVQDFLISVFAVDPVEAVRKARVRTLIVQGRNDLQVTVEDARLLNKAPRTKMELISDMNHVLKDAPFDRAGNLATYANPSLPVSPRLVREIEDFIENDD